jgi:hypothetical protein
LEINNKIAFFCLKMRDVLRKVTDLGLEKKFNFSNNNFCSKEAVRPPHGHEPPRLPWFLEAALRLAQPTHGT